MHIQIIRRDIDNNNNCKPASVSHKLSYAHHQAK